MFKTYIRQLGKPYLPSNFPGYVYLMSVQHELRDAVLSQINRKGMDICCLDTDDAIFILDV